MFRYQKFNLFLCKMLLFLKNKWFECVQFISGAFTADQIFLCKSIFSEKSMDSKCMWLGNVGRLWKLFFCLFNCGLDTNSQGIAQKTKLGEGENKDKHQLFKEHHLDTLKVFYCLYLHLKIFYALCAAWYSGSCCKAQDDRGICFVVYIWSKLWYFG